MLCHHGFVYLQATLVCYFIAGSVVGLWCWG
jgi:hypothetical protein